LIDDELPTWPDAPAGTSGEQASACLAWFCMGMALATTGRLDEALDRLDLPVEVRAWAEAYGRHLLGSGLGQDGGEPFGLTGTFFAPAKPAPAAFKLSATEAMVARLVADGRSNKQIAAELVVSPKTIEYHLSNIYRRLGISSRVKLAQLVGLAA
jgi:DNA-binding CsgD family transcriptional regulator